MSKLAHSHQPTMDEIDRKRAIEDGNTDWVEQEDAERLANTDYINLPSRKEIEIAKLIASNDMLLEALRAIVACAQVRWRPLPPEMAEKIALKKAYAAIAAAKGRAETP